MHKMQKKTALTKTPIPTTIKYVRYQHGIKTQTERRQAIMRTCNANKV
jgi:hypothetical protein